MAKLRTKSLDPIKVFEDLSKIGRPIKFLHPHEAYEQELEQRNFDMIRDRKRKNS